MVSRFVKRVDVLMKKFLPSRIFGLAALYGVVFCVLVIVQFSNKGNNFSLSVGDMTVRGRLALNNSEENREIARQALTGGIKIFFGGIEFNLNEERGKGLSIGGNSSTLAVDPEYLMLSERSAVFGLPGGTTLTFNSLETTRGPELQIQAAFAENINEVTIPITLRRSSLVREENDQLGILYSGTRYIFTGLGHELENGKFTLSRDYGSISYRSKAKPTVFDPAEYIITQANNYDSVISGWRESIYTNWNRNTASLQNEDNIIAYLSEALRQGNYTSAVSSIPGDFLNSSRRTHRSSGYLGGMTTAYRSFTSSENERLSIITRLARERSLDVIKEDHVIDYLFTRSNNSLAQEIISMINETTPDMLAVEHSPGLLEAYMDLKRWRPTYTNSIDHLIEQILTNVSEHLNRNSDGLVYAYNSESLDLEYSLRLGRALLAWADDNNNTDWAAISRSLIISALTSETGNVSPGRLYGILKPTDNFPKSTPLADNGLWTWTVSANARAATVEGNVHISYSFPVGMTHHVIVRGVRPFVKIQIHDMDWRTDSQFERYDSSGWIYYPETQILIMKLRHRVPTETVRVIYIAEEPPAAVHEDEEDAIVH
jgi:hypothetical protein